MLDFIDLSDEYSISEVRLPASWAGKTLSTLNVRAVYGISVIALRRRGQIVITLDPNEALEAGDELVVIGSNEALAKLDAVK